MKLYVGLFILLCEGSIWGAKGVLIHGNNLSSHKINKYKSLCDGPLKATWSTHQRSLCSYNSSLSWECFPLELTMAWGIYSHSDPWASVRSTSDIGWWGLAQSQWSNSSQRCSLEFRSGFCESQPNSCTPDPENHGPRIVMSSQVTFIYRALFKQLYSNKQENIS